MSKATKIQQIRYDLEANHKIKVSEEQAERLYRVIEHDANVRAGVIINLIFTVTFFPMYLVNIPLAIMIYSHSNKLRNYEIERLDNYRVWSKVYLVLCTPLLLGIITSIYLACVVKPECYEEYEDIYRRIHKIKRTKKSSDETKRLEKVVADDDDGGDFML